MTNRHVKIINYKWNNETFLASATVKSKKKLNPSVDENIEFGNN